MNGTEITVIGNVVNSPSSVRTQNGRVTNFRLAATERRYDSASQGWVNGNTFWVDVECWGELAGNVSHSISKGDPVVVVGTIHTHEWESDEGAKSKPRIKARAIGPNLSWGIADFKKTPRSSAVPRPDEGQAPAEPPADERYGDLSGMRVGEDYVLEGAASEAAGSEEDRVPEPALR